MLLILLAVSGLALLSGGGELLVRGALSMAERLRISPLLAGLTIVGFGTSTPELATSIQAAISGAPGIALGNVIGSNIANILLILGASALVLPLAANRHAFWRDAIALLGSSALAAVAVILGIIGPLIGAMLLSLLIVYVFGLIALKNAQMIRSRHAIRARLKPARARVHLPVC